MLRGGAVSRGVLALVIGVSPVARASAESGDSRATKDELRRFDAGFREGQQQFNKGEFLPAARTWTAAAEVLREGRATAANRAAIFEYIAEAYQKAIAGAADEAVVREAVAVLDAYCEGFVAAYPGEEPSPRISEARVKLRAMLPAEVVEPEPEPEVERAPVVPPPEPVAVPRRTAPPPRRWKGLVAGGGLAIGGGAAMLGMFAVGFTRARAAEAEFEAQGDVCTSVPSMCTDIDARGHTAEAVAVAGLVAAPLLLAAGAGMLAVGLKRRPARQAWTPVMGPRMVGFMWERRF
jgi:hypothetical protein